MHVQPRQQQILDALATQKLQRVASLARKFRVADMTIRRDLRVLEKAGKVVRTWGGVMLAEHTARELSFQEKIHDHEDEKIRIAKKAIDLIRPGHTIFMDTGTTALQTARCLNSACNVQIITCSLPIMLELMHHTGVTTTIPGGTIHPETREVYGPLTEKNISGIRADIAFLGTDAIGPDGELLTSNMQTARMSELIMHASKTKVLLADHSKWSESAPVQFGHVNQLDMIITGKQLPKTGIKTIRSHEVELVRV